MRYRHLIYTGFVSLLFFASCAPGKKTAVVHQPAAVAIADEKARLRTEETFISANQAKTLGNYEEAKALFLEVIRRDPRNAASMYELARLYMSAGRNDDALLLAEKAAAISPGNKWYLKLYGEILLQKKRFKEAARTFAAVTDAFPNDYDSYLDRAYALEYAQDYAEAVKVYDQLEAMTGVEESITLQKQRLYIRMGKMDKAVAELQKLIRAYPKEMRYYGLLAELYEANNMPDKAFEIYGKMMEADPDNPYAHLGLAGYYKTKGDRAKYMQELTKAFEKPDLNIDIKVTVYLFPYFKLIESDSTLKKEALELSGALVKAHPQEAKAFAIYGDFLYHDKQVPEALKQYRQALAVDNNHFTVWQQMFIIHTEQQQFDSLLSVADEALTYFPDQPSVHYFRSVALLQKKEYGRAIDALHDGLKIGTDNEALLSQMYANLGECYYQNKEYASSDSSFEQSVRYDPSNAFVLNNYSYYLSLRKEKLDKAEQMAKEANRLSAGNSAFEDTYGWVLYQSGKHRDARQWLEKSLSHGGDQRPVIVEHYGDILFRLGDEDKAVEQWKKARELGSDSPQIEQKIRDRKLYE